MIDTLQTTFSNAYFRDRECLNIFRILLEFVHSSRIDNKIALVRYRNWQETIICTLFTYAYTRRAAS